MHIKKNKDVKPIEICYQNLANEIVVQACRDYRHYRQMKKSTYGIERFFKSEYFMLLTNVDGKRLLSQLSSEFDRNVKL